jgi:hypothetical protein
MAISARKLSKLCTHEVRLSRQKLSIAHANSNKESYFPDSGYKFPSDFDGNLYLHISFELSKI